MGYNSAGLHVTARLSSHNDERDDRDEALWTELRDRIAEIVNDPKFADISPMVS